MSQDEREPLPSEASTEAIVRALRNLSPIHAEGWGLVEEAANRLEAFEKKKDLKVGDKYNGHKMTPLTLSVKEIVDEYKGATQKFGAFHSAHEGYAIILEELDELKDEVFKQHPQRTKERLRAEARQVAAMALRFMVDVAS